MPVIAVATEAVEREHTLTDFDDAAAKDVSGIIAATTVNKSGRITLGILIATSTP
jgi:hypothetical protein